MNKFDEVYNRIISEAKLKQQNSKKTNKFNKDLQKKEVQTEDGECAAAAGITTNSTFGPPSDCPSVVQPSQKTADDPGVSTKDINQLYTPHMGTPIIGQFRRYTVKKRKKKK